MIKWSAIGDQVSQDIDNQIDILHHLGFKYIEIRKISNRFIYEYSYESIQKISKKLTDTGMRCSCVSTDIGKRGDVNFAYFFKCIDYAKILHAPYVRVFGYFFTKQRQQINYALKYAENANILLLVENEYGTNIQTPADIANLFNEFGNLRLLFDAGNAYRSGMHYIMFFKTVYTYISYIHLKDIRLDNSKQIGTSIGKGKLEVLQMINDLSLSNYSGFLSLEPYVYLGDNTQHREKVFIKYWENLREKVDL